MILILSGTSDGRALTELVDRALTDFFGDAQALYVSTLTPYGADLAISHTASHRIHVLQGAKDQQAMVALIRQYGIRVIIDATHPYAVHVSQNALAAVQDQGIAYLRYERPSSLVEGDVLYFSDYEALVEALSRESGAVLTTTGSNHLDRFKPLIEQERLYARILPTAAAIQKAEALGLSAGKIIAVQGPFSVDYNRVMLETYGIRWLVTKDSASAGGFREKIEAARQVGIQTMILKRPEGLNAPVFQDFQTLLAALERILAAL